MDLSRSGRIHPPAKSNDFFFGHIYLIITIISRRALVYFTVISEVNINLEVYEDSFEIRYKIKRTLYI